MESPTKSAISHQNRQGLAWLNDVQAQQSGRVLYVSGRGLRTWKSEIKQGNDVDLFTIK